MPVGIISRDFIRSNAAWANLVQAAHPGAIVLKHLGAIVRDSKKGPWNSGTNFIQKLLVTEKAEVWPVSSCSDQKAKTKPNPWHVAACGAKKWWPTQKGAGVKVGILDSGVRAHSEFPEAVENRLYVADGSYTDPQTGSSGHGTFVASLVAGRSSGVAPSAKICSAEVLLGGVVYPEYAAHAIDWCLGEGCRILLASWETDNNDVVSLVEAATDTGTGSDALVIAAIGNDGKTRTAMPGNKTFAVGVGAIDEAGNPWACSSFGGTKPDLSTVGKDIVGASAFTGEYKRASGTSLAGAIVAGACALIAANEKPGFSVADLRKSLMKYVKPGTHSSTTGPILTL